MTYTSDEVARASNRILPWLGRNRTILGFPSPGAHAPRHQHLHGGAAACAGHMEEESEAGAGDGQGRQHARVHLPRQQEGHHPPGEEPKERRHQQKRRQPSVFNRQPPPLLSAPPYCPPQTLRRCPLTAPVVRLYPYDGGADGKGILPVQVRVTGAATGAVTGTVVLASFSEEKLLRMTEVVKRKRSATQYRKAIISKYCLRGSRSQMKSLHLRPGTALSSKDNRDSILGGATFTASVVVQ
eukprot:1176091-Prorocentrum_minimum.AAC.1